ncbi:MAG TPA: DEAD/DEAH box helicase family protein [Bacteroidales bacterium]|nr:DEAD/DEAH box helicase family protein [Bacteroidales bacterium]
MILYVTSDKKYIKVKEANDYELSILKDSLKKRIKNWYFNPLVKANKWDGYVNFFKYNSAPIGLWNEIYNICQSYSIDLKIEGLKNIFDLSIDYNEFIEWVNDFFKDNDIKPRDYQIKTAYDILKYKYCTSSVTTSAGKTLIAFIVFAYIKTHSLGNKYLIIVPTTILTTQMMEEFIKYNNDKMDLSFSLIYSNSKIISKDPNVVIGTYQSIVKFDKEFLSNFDVIYVDECHKAGARSIRNIIKKCSCVNYKFGMSGTIIKDNTAEYYTILSLLGPVLNRISPDFLFKEGFAPFAKFRIVMLNYNRKDISETLFNLRTNKNLEKSKAFYYEKVTVLNNNERLNFILKMIEETDKNSMVLFSDIKNKYGYKIYEYLKNNTDKICYYVDGNIEQDHRSYYQSEMETGNNKVIIASFLTFATGISIKNIHYIFFAESYKSEILVKQSIGRGMRQLKDKSDFYIIDFVDNLSFNNNKNYLYKHGVERYKIYKQYSSDIKIFNVDSPFSLSFDKLL